MTAALACDGNEALVQLPFGLSCEPADSAKGCFALQLSVVLHQRRLRVASTSLATGADLGVEADSVSWPESLSVVAQSGQMRRQHL